MPHSAEDAGPALTWQALLYIDSNECYDTPGPWYYRDGKPYDGRGPAPEHHPERCHAISTTGRCPKWATILGMCGSHQRLWYQHMGKYYGVHLAPTLKQRMEEYLNSTERQKQLEIYEEIALSRTMLAEHVALMSVTIVAHQEGKVAADAVTTAMSIVQDGVERVARLCSQAAVIEKTLQDKVSAKHLDGFIQSITQVIFEVLGKDSPHAVAITDRLKQGELPLFEAQTIRVTHDE